MDNSELLKMALVGYRFQVQDISARIAAIERELRGGKPEAVAGKRGMSAAGRARISAAQRARWAKVRARKQAA